MELPKYPPTEAPPMPDESWTRQLATALWVVEAVLVVCSLPVQLLMLFSLGWEGGDEAAKHRLIEAMPLLGMGGLLLVALAAVTAPTVWHGSGEAVVLSCVAAVLTVLLAIGWATALRGALLDPTFGVIWLVMTLPAPTALALLLVVRRRVRPVSQGRGSLPR